MSGTHDPLLVCVSILIAMIASYTALDLAGRIRASQGLLKRAWLATAAVAMGGGIWAMHFVAMLAFRMPGMALGYDIGLTLLSLGVAILVTGVGFLVMSRAHGSLLLLAEAGIFMGLGIVAMHYIGMAAMRMPAALKYDPVWLGISVLIALVAATTALWLASRDRHPLERFGAAVVMGGAIAGMHFAGMRAAIFTAMSGGHARGSTGVGTATLAFAVSAAAFLILFLSLLAAMFDRRFAVLAEREALALRESEERFRALYRGTPLPLHSLDRAGRIDKVSNAWLDLLGYDRDEVLGRPLINCLTEASARQFVQRDWPELIGADVLAEREYRAVTKAGVFLDLVSTMRVERDDAGNFLSVVGGFTDVTGRKQAEEALRQAQKLEAIGQLTGGIAHDFNNLLSVIVGNLELLRKRLPEDPKAIRFLDGAYEGAQRGASLTQRLLAFARRQDLRPRPVSVAELVQGMTGLLRRALGPAVRVETHFPLDLPPAMVDANQLEMALLNLAVNARDAMPDGGTIDISAGVTLLDEQSHGLAAGRYVKLALADTGAGMDEETLKRATDPFFTTKGLGKGTGLGLPMVQGLAAQSGGRLVLQSTVGRGTVAELYLPVAEGVENEAPSVDRGASAVLPGASATILVVDDDDLVLENTAAMLEDLGHRVLRAASGAAALALLEQQQVDLIVTDQAMPEMTGLDLIEKLAVCRPALPVLLVSGLVDLDPGRTGRIQVLGKPFSQNDLADAVATAIGTSAAIPIARGRRPGY